GHRELDVAEPLAAHLRLRDLDAAAVADDAAVADALVLAAVALPVLDRAEDLLAEQAVLLGLERAVVDRLRLRDLAVRPAADHVGRGEADADLVEADLAALVAVLEAAEAHAGGRGGQCRLQIGVLDHFGTPMMALPMAPAAGAGLRAGRRDESEAVRSVPLRLFPRTGLPDRDSAAP